MRALTLSSHSLSALLLSSLSFMHLCRSQIIKQRRTMKWKILFFVLTFVAFNSGSQWSYQGQNGPIHWQGVCQNGAQQSPIDLENEIFDSGLEPVDFKHYSDILHTVNITNNGHTVKIHIPDNVSAEIVLEADTFKLAQIHFHWGDESLYGSEHLWNGQAFPMEMHLVHHNTK